MARASDLNPLLSLLRDQTFQAREIRRVLVFTTLYVLVTTAMLGVFYHQMLGSMVAGVSPLMYVAEDMQDIDAEMPKMAAMLGRWLLIMMVVNLVVTLAAGVYIVRKLGQPIMALRRVVRELGAGNLDVRVRDGKDDEFREIFETLREAGGQLREAVSAVREPLQAALDAPDEPARRAALERCRVALDYFNTGER